MPRRTRHFRDLSGLWRRKTTFIAALSITASLVHLALRYDFHLAVLNALRAAFPPTVIHDL